MNIFAYAMQMELDGEDFYLRLAEVTPQEGLKQIFRWLASDERKHYEIFQQMQEQASDLAMAESAALEGAKNIFAELQQAAEYPTPEASNLEAYRYAMQVEADSATLYQEAAAKESDPRAAELLRRIAMEERQHFTIMENLYDFVNAPNQSLVWGEFSNLKEF